MCTMGLLLWEPQKPGIRSTEAMAFVSSPTPAHPSTPQGCPCSTLPGLPASSIPAWITVIPTVLRRGWLIRVAHNLLQTCHNQQAAGLGQALLRDSWVFRAQPRWAVFLRPPVTNPAARYQQRSGRECARSIRKCRQDHSEHLLPACPCSVVGQRMGGKVTQECSPLTLLQCGCKQGCRATLGLTGPPAGTAHGLHSRITSGSNTGSPTQPASGILGYQPHASAGAVPGRFWFCTQALAVGGQRAQVPHGAISSRW